MPEQDITQLIAQVRRGDEAASDDLFRRVYRELRQLAAHYMRHERRDHTLEPTALVHEAYLRLSDQRHLTRRRGRSWSSTRSRRILRQSATGKQS